jgi:membrane protease YdiL (CAAX protease family)
VSGAPEPETPDWPVWLAPAGVGLALGSFLVLSFLVIGVLAAAGLDVQGKDKGVANVIATLLQDGAFVGAALYLVARHQRGRVRPADFGLRATRLRDGAVWAVAAIVAYFAFALVWNQIVGQGNQQKDLFRELGVGRHSAGIALLAVLVCVIAPVAEEFFFRGFGFGVLLGRVGVLRAAVLVGLVFGAVHISSTPVELLPELAFLGFVLCLLRWRTGSLLPCIAVHATNNAVAYGALLHWGWQIPLLVVGALAALAVLLRPVTAPGPVAVGL